MRAETCVMFWLYLQNFWNSDIGGSNELSAERPSVSKGVKKDKK